MSGRWFRFYDEAIDEPKVLRLSPEMRWQWVAVLAIACRYDGKIPSDEDVSLLLRTTVSQAEIIMHELVSRGLVDERRSGYREPHNWRKRQFKSDVSTPRVKRFRERFKAVAETPPDTEQNRAEAETEQTVSASLRSAETPAAKIATMAVTVAEEPKAGPAKRATRLPADFAPDLGEALSLGLGFDRASAEAAKFRDHFSAAPGQRGVKQDWPATWRNWCRRAAETGGGGGGRAPPRRAVNGFAAHALDLMEQSDEPGTHPPQPEPARPAGAGSGDGRPAPQPDLLQAEPKRAADGARTSAYHR